MRRDTTIRTTNRFRLHAIALTMAMLFGIVTILASASSANAGVHSRHVSWAPHLAKRIVHTKARNHGSQLATWYGPGFFGNRTACGKTLQRGTWGIAHRTLPCNTLVTLNHRGRKVSVRVIDRGPFSGATVDLTSRTKEFLRFTSGTVRMTVVKKFRILPGRPGARR